jgi:uncharacterized protein (DUF302 family)
MVYEESIVLTLPFDDVVANVKAALAAEGFGTLTEIDMQATLLAKVGKEMDRYVIVGACNPKLASAALDIEPLVGVLLPCNVVIRAVDDKVSVDAMDPGLMATMSGRPELQPIADEARRLVNAALARVNAAAEQAEGIFVP